MSLQYIAHVARRKQDLDAFAQPPRYAAELNAARSEWHRNIAKHEIKVLAALDDLNCLGTIPGRNNLIAELA
jgi:hypothetical protein